MQDYFYRPSCHPVNSVEAVKVKVKSTMLHKSAYWGAHLPLPGLEPIGENH